MIEVLLLAIAIVVFVGLHRKRDWYVVELRSADDAKLCDFAFGADPYRHGLGPKLKVEGFEREAITSNFVQLNHKDGGSVTLNQVVLADLEAAKIYALAIDAEARHAAQSDGVRFRYQRTYVWRIVARARSSAVTLPPSLYSDKDGIVLWTLPGESWHGPKSANNVGE
jgi:hypothetical protein